MKLSSLHSLKVLLFFFTLKKENILDIPFVHACKHLRRHFGRRLQNISFSAVAKVFDLPLPMGDNI